MNKTIMFTAYVDTDPLDGGYLVQLEKESLSDDDDGWWCNGQGDTERAAVIDAVNAYYSLIEAEENEG